MITIERNIKSSWRTALVTGGLLIGLFGFLMALSLNSANEFYVAEYINATTITSKAYSGSSRYGPSSVMYQVEVKLESGKTINDKTDLMVKKGQNVCVGAMHMKSSKATHHYFIHSVGKCGELITNREAGQL